MGMGKSSPNKTSKHSTTPKTSQSVTILEEGSVKVMTHQRSTQLHREPEGATYQDSPGMLRCEKSSSATSGTIAAWSMGRSMDGEPIADRTERVIIGETGEGDLAKASKSQLPWILLGGAFLAFFVITTLHDTYLGSLTTSIMKNVPVGAGCFMAGDIIAQVSTRANDPKFTYQPMRTIRALMLGIFMNGFIYTFWLSHLNR